MQLTLLHNVATSSAGVKALDTWLERGAGEPKNSPFTYVWAGTCGCGEGCRAFQSISVSIIYLSAWPEATLWLAACAAAAFALRLQWGPCAMDADSQQNRGEECTAITVCVSRFRNKEESGCRCRFVYVCVICVCLRGCLLWRQASIKPSVCGLATKIGHAGAPAIPFLHRCLFHFLYLSPWTVKVLPSNYRFTLPFSPLPLHLAELFQSHYNPQLLLPWLHRSVLECTLKLIVNNLLGSSGLVCVMYSICNLYLSAIYQ